MASHEPILDVLLMANDSHNPGSEVHALILKHIQGLVIPKQETSICLIKELGGFLARATDLLSALAKELAECEEVLNYLGGRFDGMDLENGMADTQDVKQLNDKHRILR
jgi:hypothetical protein